MNVDRMMSQAHWENRARLQPTVSIAARVFSAHLAAKSARLETL